MRGLFAKLVPQQPDGKDGDKEKAAAGTAPGAGPGGGATGAEGRAGKDRDGEGGERPEVDEEEKRRRDDEEEERKKREAEVSLAAWLVARRVYLGFPCGPRDGPDCCASRAQAPRHSTTPALLSTLSARPAAS